MDTFVSQARLDHEGRLTDDSPGYMVLDDVKVDDNVRWKMLFGAQKQFELCDKYRPKKSVQWGRPLIYLCNHDCDPRLSPLWSYLEQVSVMVILDQKLY